MKQNFFIALTEDLPAPIQDMFAEFLILRREKFPHLQAASFEFVHGFVDAHVYIRGTQTTVRLLFPSNVVLAILEAEQGKFPLGFVG